MTNDQLLVNIRHHERVEHFKVVETDPVADGVILVRENDGECTLYFDKEIIKIRENTVLEDVSSKIPSIRPNTGFVANVRAVGLSGILQTAKYVLVKIDGTQIDWWK